MYQMLPLNPATACVILSGCLEFFFTDGEQNDIA